MNWRIVFVSAAAEREVGALPADMKARFLRIGDMIQDFGLAAMREPHVKHIDGKVWEIRLKGKDGIARSLYAAASGHRVVILRTFVKKTQATPRREIDIALARLHEIRG